MKAKTTREFLKYIFSKTIIQSPHTDMLNELAELEAKAAELDRRENGVVVFYNGYGVLSCGNCMGSVRQNKNESKFCFRCGTKLIWEVTP